MSAGRSRVLAAAMYSARRAVTLPVARGRPLDCGVATPGDDAAAAATTPAAVFNSPRRERRRLARTAGEARGVVHAARAVVDGQLWIRTERTGAIDAAPT